MELGENQELLIRGFADARDPTARIVILDGHVLIQNAFGLSSIDGRVFSRLGVNIIAHLEADPARIQNNRALDVDRQRPSLTAEEIRNHQEQSLSAARGIADDLGIPLKCLNYDDATEFGRFLSDLR